MMLSLFAAALMTAAPAATTKPTDPSQKVRCKKEVETGTLAKVTKVCHTAAEWDEQRRQSRKAGEDMQDGYKGQAPQ